MLTRYFTDINQRTFNDYSSLFTPAKRTHLDPGGYRSTKVSSAQLLALDTASDGRPAATVTFTSTQNPEDGPDGETCTHWTVIFFPEAQGDGTYLFGLEPTNYRALYTAC